MGWEYVKSSGLLDEAPELYGNEVRTVLGYSSGAVPTILTGKVPAEHGRWNLLRYSPNKSPFAWTRFLKFLPEPMLENRYSRKAINIISKRIARSEGYFSSHGLPVRHLSSFDVCETTNIYKPGGITGSRNVFDYFIENDIPYKSYSYHDGSDEALIEQAESDLSAGSESVFFLYLAELDDYLHHHCYDLDGIHQRVSWYFEKINKLVAVAQSRASDVRFHVFSDHGMTPIREHYDLIGYLQKAGVGPKSNYISVFDSTMARFWFSDTKLRDGVLSALRECPAGRILKEEELRDLGIFFPDDRYGEVIFLLEPGILIHPCFFGNYAPAGMHGFHPDDPHSSAAYVSNVAEHRPAGIENLYDMITTEALRAKGN